MRYTTSSVLLALAASSSAAIVRRDAQTIINDMNTIDTNVKALSSAIGNYNGGISNAIPITSAESTLDKSIQQGTTDAKSTSTLSDSDATSILNAVSSLRPDIIDSLNAVTAKSAQFSADKLSSVVTTDLTQLKSDTDAFSDALVAIAPADMKDQANAAKSAVDADFSSAMAGSSVASVAASSSASASASSTASSEASATSGASSSASSASSSVTSAASSASGTTSSRASSATSTASLGASSATSAAASPTESTAGAGSIKAGGVFAALFAAVVGLVL